MRTLHSRQPRRMHREKEKEKKIHEGTFSLFLVGSCAFHPTEYTESLPKSLRSFLCVWGRELCGMGKSIRLDIFPIFPLRVCVHDATRTEVWMIVLVWVGAFCGGVSCTRSLNFFFFLPPTTHSTFASCVSCVVFIFIRATRAKLSLFVGRSDGKLSSTLRPFFNTQFFCAFSSLAVDEEKCGYERK